MIGLKEHKYITKPKQVIDPLSAVVGVGLIVGSLILVVFSRMESTANSAILFADVRSLGFVLGGTFGCLLFQFDISSCVRTFMLIVQSLLSSPTKNMSRVMDELDEAIIKGANITSLRDGNDITGDMLNDVIHMIKEKLFYEEIEGFVSNQVATAFLTRKVAVSLLNKGAKIAPSLGLLGTVIGLVGVLQSLDNPADIGPAMSLALMTTAFGSILGSFIFTPLAGRLEHHNRIYLETHKLMMNRIRVLLQREERHLNPVITNKKLDTANET